MTKIIVKQDVPPHKVLFIDSAANYGRDRLSKEDEKFWDGWWDLLDRFAEIATSDQFAAMFILSKDNFRAAGQYMTQAITIYEENQWVRIPIGQP